MDLFKTLFKRKPLPQTNHEILWEQQLREPVSRYLYYGFEEFSAIKYLRDSELENPSPFSHRTFLDLNSFNSNHVQYPFDRNRYKSCTVNRYKMNVPIMNIIGAGTTNNMSSFSVKYTYREVLFYCLHGAGVDMDSLNFLHGDQCKDKTMPHTIVNRDSKTRSVAPLTLTRYGDYFFSSNGHQRTVFAMYYIWQKEGMNGLLKNVTVSELFPLPIQDCETAMWK